MDNAIWYEYFIFIFCLQLQEAKDFSDKDAKVMENKPDKLATTTLKF